MTKTTRRGIGAAMVSIVAACLCALLFVVPASADEGEPCGPCESCVRCGSCDVVGGRQAEGHAATLDARHNPDAAGSSGIVRASALCVGNDAQPCGTPCSSDGETSASSLGIEYVVLIANADTVGGVGESSQAFVSCADLLTQASSGAGATRASEEGEASAIVAASSLSSELTVVVAGENGLFTSVIPVVACAVAALVAAVAAAVALSDRTGKGLRSR